MPPATNSSSTLLNDPAFVSTSTLNGPNALQLYDAANDKYTEPHRPSRQHGTIRTMNRVSIEQPAQAHIGVTQRQPPWTEMGKDLGPTDSAAASTLAAAPRGMACPNPTLASGVDGTRGAMGAYMHASPSAGYCRLEREARHGGTITLAAYFCTPCALTQEHREIELEENAIIQRLESGEGVNRAEPRQPPRQQSMMQAGSGLPLESSEKNRNNGQDR
ncbi:hypothetical protein FRB97_005074 [Tulasnella sp. 331]|nr:hypothetical protein FRB97_005074 [Tulasnella sp. 331]